MKKNIKPKPKEIYVAKDTLPDRPSPDRPFLVLAAETSSSDINNRFVTGIPGATSEKYNLISSGATVLIKAKPGELKKDTHFLPKLPETIKIRNLAKKIGEISDEEYELVQLHLATYLGFTNI